MTTKTKKPAFVQLRANREVDSHVEPAQHRGEVEFCSIYLGEPGSYQWVADFADPDAAVYAAYQMVDAFDCKVDRSQCDEVMCAPAPVSQPMPQPKGHPHAALMAEYAKDAAETDKPWRRWEASIGPNQPWVACIGHPSWAEFYSFRRKPEQPKTIMVNGFKVPAPETKKILPRTYYAPAPDEASYWRSHHYSTVWAQLCFERGLLHTTKEAAVAHAKAMLGIDPKEIS